MWDKFYIELAEFVAGKSKDPGTKVGAVIVRPDNTVASIAYNGFPRGATDDVERMRNDRAWKLARTIHAEANAILHCREPMQGYSIYVWPLAPCSHCAAMICQVGIKHVYYPPQAPSRWQDSCSIGAELFFEAGVVVREVI